MPVQLTRQSFRNVVLLSGLVTTEGLDIIDRKHASTTRSAQELSELLVNQGDVRVWQTRKLLQAKHRGFHPGRYQLQSKVARGRMSNIYTARDHSNSEDYVWKVLPLSRVAEASYSTEISAGGPHRLWPGPPEGKT